MANKEFDKEELKKLFQLRDRVVRVMDKEGKFRISAVKNSTAARTAQINHKLSYLPAFFLARQLSAASLIASFLKGEERIAVSADGDGPIRKVFAEAIQVGEVRGYVEFNHEKKDVELTQLSDALGNGTYSVTRILYNKNEPVTGIVELQNGDIATDLASYFSQSEQIPTAVVLDADIGEDGIIKHSGGIIVQAMPGASDEDLEKVFESLQGASRMNEFFEKEYTPLGILKELLPFEVETVRSAQLDFFCRCSKDAFVDKLVTLGIDEVKDMRKAGNNELHCQFCNAKYILEDEDFDKIETELKANKN